MKIACVGGGPAGLYFAILMKKLDPSHELAVFERNGKDDTFGWGVVFSDETLGNFEREDPESYADITANFAYWDTIETYYQGQCVSSKGHGFCGLSRKRLLNVLQDRATALGVEIAYHREIADVAELDDHDVIVASDGINSLIRDAHAEHFRPVLDWRQCKFCWLGTDLRFEAFTFIFEETEHGLFQVHAYPFEDDRSTFIVECHEDTWRRAGLDGADEEQTVAFVSELFAERLQGHRILTNRSLWRTFPTVTNQVWHHGKVVLAGDALHTAHFSIGSGTKLAMEDAIALRDAFRDHPGQPIGTVFESYQSERALDVAKKQRSAQHSLEWYENSRRYLGQHPLQFKFNMMTRSKAISYDNLRVRDPDFVRQVSDWFARDRGAPVTSSGELPVPVFTPFRLRDMELVNRIVCSPMCMYSSEDGRPTDWHLVHLGSRAVGGAGLIFTEGTAVSAEGRISPGDAGMYSDEHVDAWRRIVDFVHEHSQAKIAMQLAHAGRKGSTRLLWEGMDEPLPDGNWPLMSASAIPYQEGNQVPKEMDRADMDLVRDQFVEAARRADRAGFDLIELHAAHGYLLASFISPLLNRRCDDYGGGVAARMRFPLEVFDAVRAAWPSAKPISVRISATDWKEGGQTGDDSVAVARLLKEHGCDIVDVSAGQTVPDQQPIYGRMFQTKFSDQIRHEAGIPTMTVGNLQDVNHCNTILAAGRADLCVLARPHLQDPYLAMHAAEQYGYHDLAYPPQYLAVKPAPKD